MRATIPAVIALTAVFIPQSARAQANWIGPSGGGMLAVQEADTIGSGHFSFGIVGDNYDRDPLGLDIVDIRIAWRLGIANNFDLYGRYEISRAVSYPGGPPVPPPPLDIVVPGGARIPREPYRAIYWPMPYLADYDGASVMEKVPGEYVFGVKTRIRKQRGFKPALSLSAEIHVPGDYSAYYLRKGSGSGSVDVGIHSAATWRTGRLTASVNAGYTFNGSVRRSDRIITDNGWRDVPIVRPDILHGGIGVRFRIFRGLSVCGEYAGWQPIRYRTPIYDDIGNADALVGLQAELGHIVITAGVRHHFEPLSNGLERPTGPLADALDLSGVSPQEAAAYLGAFGIRPGDLRAGAGTVVISPPSGILIPEGAKLIPSTYRTNTKGNDAIIVAVALRF